MIKTFPPTSGVYIHTVTHVLTQTCHFAAATLSLELTTGVLINRQIIDF